MTRDLRTLIEPRTPRNPAGLQAGACNRGAAVEADAIGRAAVEADAIGEQQLKRTQSGSSSRSRRDREQQLKWTQSMSSSWNSGSGRKRGAAAEADATGEQQLCTESCPAPRDYSW